ncbi:hypothetical protein [Carbonactinospora thermoautotrophica]|uniref:Uncharacterized protein n=1 Tax=Carbonactinospora thermoautotrophica TaxID=1469144 RepID=A0A132MT47_9ACTN|nr:hypothetical protein [Carbonactinospora thermoautotrophica]KWX00999.1 hypothetical protein LI90_2027 [Carbonactinospora thermoautotrophica]
MSRRLFPGVEPLASLGIMVVLLLVRRRHIDLLHVCSASCPDPAGR